MRTLQEAAAYVARLDAGEDIERRPRRRRTPDDAVELTVDTLYAAHGSFVRSPAWRAFCRRFGIATTVRVLDATFGGPAGAHPHFHVAVLPCQTLVTDAERRSAAIYRPVPPMPEDATPAELARYHDQVERIRAERHRALDPAATWGDAVMPQLSTDEQAAVLGYLERDVREAWRDAVEDWTGFRPPTTACLRLTPSEDAARYFTAWGLPNELGATPIKARSHLRLLDAAAAGHTAAGAAFVEWRAATAGRSWVTGLGRARRRLGVTQEDVDAHRKEQQRRRDNHHAELASAGLVEPLRLLRPLSLVVPAYLWRAAARVGFDVLERAADQADEQGTSPQDAVIAACWSSRGPPYSTVASSTSTTNPPASIAATSAATICARSSA